MRTTCAGIRADIRCADASAPQAVNCAFQWAQRPDTIYLNVKFSARIDGPVTVLNVDNEKVEMGNNTLTFEGIGRQKPKTFKLNLTFHGVSDSLAAVHAHTDRSKSRSRARCLSLRERSLPSL